MKKVLLSMLLVLSSVAFLQAADINAKQIAIDLEIKPYKKVIKQWERIFDDERKMKRYGIDRLSEEEKAALKAFLIKHAKDSDSVEGCAI